MATDSFFVTRTMQTLEMLAFQPASAPEVAELLRVDARTARRLLNRLADEGWLIRMEGRVRTYRLSMRIVALAAHAAEMAPLTVAGRAPVKALHERTGATAHLVVPSYRSVLCLLQRGAGPKARPRLRELVPAHASAGGKVLLGHRGPWRESVLELPLERLTDDTMVDPDDIREQALEAAERGYATESGEYCAGLESVAAPVRDASGDVVAAVAVTGPAGSELLERVDDVRASAADVSSELAESAL